MPGIAALGKLFFQKNAGPGKASLASKSAAPCIRRSLVVGKIIRRKSRRRNEHLVAVDENAPVATPSEFTFV
jgi:hypothetical protein